MRQHGLVLFTILVAGLVACDPGKAGDDTGPGGDTGTSGDAGAGTGLDVDGDGYHASVDCDDADPDRHPGADEYCNSLDDDCDEVVDEDAIDAATLWVDRDGDGYGAPGETTEGCDSLEGWADNDLDCDDGNASVNPDTTWYLDADGDDYGDPLTGEQSCEQPAEDMVLDDSDCDDTRDGVNPGETEVCNGRDKDCNGIVDDNCLVVVSRNDRTAAFYGGTTGQELGSALDIGDIDGDGILDVVIGARGRSSGGSDRGGAFVVHGPHEGSNNISSAADAVIAGVDDDAYVGNQVSVIPDWDGDGRDEVMVGGWGAVETVDGAGAAWIFNGPVDGSLTVDDADAAVRGGDILISLTKWVMDGRGDNTGDGTSDLLLGAIDWYIIAGKIFWFEGPVTGNLVADDADATFEGAETRQYFGYGAWNSTDFDGDGLDDLLSGTPGRSSWTKPKGAGEAWAFRAPFAGVYTRDDVDWKVQGEQYDDFLGTLHCGGDFDGDGYGDAVVTAKWKPTDSGGDNAGALYMYRGGKTFLEEEPTWTLESDRGHEYLGHDGNELDAGDINGDGLDDLAIGWQRWGVYGEPDGAVLVQFGPLEGFMVTGEVDRMVQGPEVWSLMGDAVKLVDMDGDGEDELWAGAPDADDIGRVWLLDSSLFYN